jgi:hypothetical protein
MAMLNNQAANLKNVIPENAVRYHSAMLEAKKVKTEATLNRVIHTFKTDCKVYLFFCSFNQSLGDSYTADAYDELLTQAEIQGHVNSVNGKIIISSKIYILYIFLK